MGGEGVAMDFPMASAAMPRRLRKKMSESEAKSPATVEAIEAKLRRAHLRRQQFYEKLSRKARPKQRSPSRNSSQEKDLAQRLEARLQAAEQKRLSILENSQKRLARLDELRQAAKTSVEMRFERDREALGSKVELRVQQAEANRMLLLNAYMQRRATLKERTSQSLLRRIVRESKYKERVRAAIYQKRLAAEKKRSGLLEAEKRKAHARVLQVRRVATSVSKQREFERRKILDQLEDRLQKARRMRAEYLRQRARQRTNVQLQWNRMHKQADVHSGKIARCWRQFLLSRRTTLDLVREYDALKINEKCVKSMPFDQLVLAIESTATIRTVRALLDRLESRFQVYKGNTASQFSSSMSNIDHLLQRVATPKKRSVVRTPMRASKAMKITATWELNKRAAKLQRYPVRVVLCAYMILVHPDAVFSGQGEHESALVKSAEKLVLEFELLTRVILDGPLQISDKEPDVIQQKRCTFRSQLAAFDSAWCSYLNCFVVWKVKDAESLEQDLVRAACQLELSMIQKCKLSPGGETDALTHDLKAIQKQVSEDQQLFREKMQHLSGEAGVQRMEFALSETRSKYFQAKETGSPVGSPIANLHSPGSQSTIAGPSSVTGSRDRSLATESIEEPSRVVHTLFKEADNNGVKESCCVDGQLGSIDRLITENELIVHEYLHGRSHSSVLNYNDMGKNRNSLEAKVRETIEAAFWDGVIESMEMDEPNYSRIIQLVTEVRDEICEMAPKSWKQEILDAIDLEILSQVLHSGNLDVDYLRELLKFALDVLQRLSSAAKEDDMKSVHHRLLKELAETCQIKNNSRNACSVAMVRGLRFVLEQIRELKEEISKARIMIMEPFLTGPAGLDYLKDAFAKRYGSYSDGCLPSTKLWLLSAKNHMNQEWEEHLNLLSALPIPENSLQVRPALLRSGVKNCHGTNERGLSASDIAGSQQYEPGCNGATIDSLVRLGLLKLVCAVSGLTQESLPETFMLNFLLLRAVQGEIQKLIVLSTSVLVYRQTLLMERLVASGVEMEKMLTDCTKVLLELLDQSETVGLEEIVEVISAQNGEIQDIDKLQSRKVVMARMLAKSLQAGDPVFKKVSCAVYVAARGVVLDGTGPSGRKLAETSLRQIGAAMLTDKVVEAGKVLIVAATVSISIHGPWYENLMEL